MRVVYTGGEGEITEKKSRFIATVKPVQSEEEAVAFINETKKKYWDARHNCSAFVIGERQELTRCSDLSFQIILESLAFKIQLYFNLILL